MFRTFTCQRTSFWMNLFVHYITINVIPLPHSLESVCVTLFSLLPGQLVYPAFISTSWSMQSAKKAATFPFCQFLNLSHTHTHTCTYFFYTHMHPKWYNFIKIMMSAKSYNMHTILIRCNNEKKNEMGFKIRETWLHLQ